MELSKEGTIIINALEKEREYLKFRIEQLEDMEGMTEEQEFRMKVRKGGYETLLEGLEEHLEELKKIREVQLKIKDGSISKVEMLELLKMMSNTLE